MLVRATAIAIMLALVVGVFLIFTWPVVAAPIFAALVGLLGVAVFIIVILFGILDGVGAIKCHPTRQRRLS